MPYSLASAFLQKATLSTNSNTVPSEYKFRRFLLNSGLFTSESEYTDILISLLCVMLSYHSIYLCTFNY